MQSIHVDAVTSYTGSICEYCNAIFGSFRDFISHIRIQHMDIVENIDDEDWSDEVLQTVQEERDTSNSPAKGLLVMVSHSKTKELTRWIVLPCQQQCMSASTSISNTQNPTNNIKQAKTRFPLQNISTFVSSDVCEEGFNSGNHIHKSRETIQNRQLKPSVKSRKRKITNSDKPLSAPKHLCADNDLSQILDTLGTETHGENVPYLNTSHQSPHQSISGGPILQSYFCQPSLGTPGQVSTTYTQTKKAKDLGIVTASEFRDNPQVSSTSTSSVCLSVDMTSASNNPANVNFNTLEGMANHLARILPSNQSIFCGSSKAWEDRRNKKHHYKHRKTTKKHKCRCTDPLKLCKKHIYIMPKITSSKAPEGMPNDLILPSNQSTLCGSSKAGKNQINKKHHHKYRKTTKKHRCRCADPLKLCKKHTYIMPNIMADFNSGTDSARPTGIVKTSIQPFQTYAHLGHFNDTTKLIKRTSPKMYISHSKKHASVTKPEIQEANKKSLKIKRQSEIRQSKTTCERRNCRAPIKDNEVFLGQSYGSPLDEEQVNTYLEMLQTYLNHLTKLNTKDVTKYQQVSSEAGSISGTDWLKRSGALKSNRQHGHLKNLARATGPNTETYDNHTLETKKQSQLSKLKAADQKKILLKSQQGVTISSKTYNKTKSTMAKDANIQEVGNQPLKKKRKPQPIVIKVLETERQLQPIHNNMMQDMMVQTYLKSQQKADVSSESLKPNKTKQTRRIETQTPRAGNEAQGTEEDPQPSLCMSEEHANVTQVHLKSQQKADVSSESLDKTKRTRRIETQPPRAGNQAQGTEEDPQPSLCSMTEEHANVTQVHRKRQKAVLSTNTCDKTKQLRGKNPKTHKVGNQTSKTKRKLQTIVIKVPSSTSPDKPKKAKRIETHTLISGSQISGTEKQPQSSPTILAHEQNNVLQTHFKRQQKIALLSKSQDESKPGRGTEINTKKAGILSLETERQFKPIHTNIIQKQEKILQARFKSKQKANVSSRTLDENKQTRIIEKQSPIAGNQTLRTEEKPRPSYSSMIEEQENMVPACDSTKVLDELTEQTHTTTSCTAQNKITSKTTTESKNEFQDVSYENTKIFTNNLTNSACDALDSKIKDKELDKLIQPTHSLNMPSDSYEHAENISSLDHTCKLCEEQYDCAPGLPAHIEEYHKTDIVNCNAKQWVKGQTAGAHVESNKNRSRPQLRKLLPRKVSNDLLVWRPNTVPLQKVIPTVVCNTLVPFIPQLIPISWPSTNLIDNLTLPQLQEKNQFENATELEVNDKSQSKTQHSICQQDSTALVQNMEKPNQLRSQISETNGSDSAEVQKDILSVVSNTNLATSMPHRNSLTMGNPLSQRLVNINQQSSLLPVTTKSDPPPLEQDIQSVVPTTSLGTCMPQLISKSQSMGNQISQKLHNINEKPGLSDAPITSLSDPPPLHQGTQSSGTSIHFAAHMLPQKSKRCSTIGNRQLSKKLQKMKLQTRSHVSVTNKSDQAKVFKEQLQRVKDLERNDVPEQSRSKSSLLLLKCTDADKLHNRVQATSEILLQGRNLSFQQQQEINKHDKQTQLTPALPKCTDEVKLQTKDASPSEILLSPFSTQQKTNPKPPVQQIVKPPVQQIVNPPVQQIVNPHVAQPHILQVSDILAAQPKTSSEILQQMQHTMSQKNIPFSVKSKLAKYLLEQISQIHKEEQEITLRERNAQYRCKYCTKDFPSFQSVRYHEAIHGTEHYLEKMNYSCNFTL